MSRPQFRKRATAGLRINPQDFLPRYSGQTGARIDLSGSASACARQYMRRRTGTQDHLTQAARLIAELGILPGPYGPLEKGRLQLEALARLESLRQTAEQPPCAPCG